MVALLALTIAFMFGYVSDSDCNAYTSDTSCVDYSSQCAWCVAAVPVSTFELMTLTLAFLAGYGQRQLKRSSLTARAGLNVLMRLWYFGGTEAVVSYVRRKGLMVRDCIVS